MEGIDPGKGTVIFVQISYSLSMMDVHVLNKQTRICNILFRIDLPNTGIYHNVG